MVKRDILIKLKTFTPRKETLIQIKWYIRGSNYRLEEWNSL